MWSTVFLKMLDADRHFYGAHNQKNADFPEDQPGNVTILQGGGYNILVDTGFKNPQFIEAYNAENVLKPETYLKPLNLHPDQIDAVLLSHLHYDHVGNIDCFKNAKVYVQGQSLRGGSGLQVCQRIINYLTVIWIRRI